MDVESYTFAKNSDVDLILSRPAKSNSLGLVVFEENNGPGADSEDLDERIPNIHMHVASGHMLNASPVFEAMLRRNGFAEGTTLATVGSVEIPLPDDDPDALIILLNIIHGRTRQVPRVVDIKTMTTFSVLVDKYQCREVVEVFTDMWITLLKCQNEDFSRDIFPWLSISWVFGKADIFSMATKYAQVHSTLDYWEYEATSLPIPSSVIDHIKQSRLDAITLAYGLIGPIIARYNGQQVICNRPFETELRGACDCMVLGYLIKIIDGKTLGLWPPPDPLHVSESYHFVMEHVSKILIKALCDEISRPNFELVRKYGYYHAQSHGVKSEFDKALRSQLDKFVGLKHADFFKC